MIRVAPIRSRKVPATRFARIAIAGVLAGLSLAALAPPVDARSFVDGQTTGVTKCVRVILGGYEAKRVNVLGHHFNCKPLFRGKVGQRGRFVAIGLSHSQRGADDQVVVSFRVDSLNVLIPNTIRAGITKGISFKSLDALTVDNLVYHHFDRLLVPGAQTYPGIVRAAKSRRTSKYSQWQPSAREVATVVIAELGNPDNRGTAPTQVSCDLPVFYEHDNFRGRGYIARRSQANLHKVLVSGKHMGDRFSSMCLPRGWEVTVYADINFRSRTYKRDSQIV